MYAYMCISAYTYKPQCFNFLIAANTGGGKGEEGRSESIWNQQITVKLIQKKISQMMWYQHGSLSLSFASGLHGIP